jgi:DNA-binding transcriptional regulator YiaG
MKQGNPQKELWRVERGGMESNQFSGIRNQLEKTQKQMAQLLGTSIKAVQGYEQGWRKIPGHVERQILFLLSRKRGRGKGSKPCWTVKNCPPDRKTQCPSWEFQSGTLCWFINGTICEGESQGTWQEKMIVCRQCEVFNSLI